MDQHVGPACHVRLQQVQSRTAGSALREAWCRWALLSCTGTLLLRSHCQECLRAVFDLVQARGAPVPAGEPCEFINLGKTGC